MIKRIELINFMSHKHTVIEPAAGMTVLAGPNNCGKSAVVAALQILCHNENSTYVLKHEEKTCRIIVETDEGHVIEWSRNKNGSPKYLIDDKPFDRLGRSVPPELKKVLRLPKVSADTSEFDIHFGEQKKPIFLLNDSPKASAEFFASSSDAIRLVEMQALHKQNVRDAKREYQKLESARGEIENSLEKLGLIHDLQEQVEDCEKEFFEINLAAEQIEQLESLISRRMKIEHEIARQKAVLAGFSDLTAPPEFADEESLFRLTAVLEKTHIATEKNKALELAHFNLESPPRLEAEDYLDELIEKLGSAQSTTSRLESMAAELSCLPEMPRLNDTSSIHSIIEQFESQIELAKQLEAKQFVADEGLDSAVAEIEVWVKSNPVCPTCHGAVVVENLISPNSNHDCVGGCDE